MESLVSSVVTVAVPAFAACLLVAVLVVLLGRRRFLTRMQARAELDDVRGRPVPEAPSVAPTNGAPRPATRRG